MKTILLPIDFSRNSWNALFTALKLFNTVKCEFVLLHTYQPSSGKVFKDDSSKQLWEVYEKLKEEAQASMSEVTGYLKKEYQNPHHQFRSLCLRGDLISNVNQVIQSEPVSMIIMGTQGATGAQRVFLGSNTVRVLKHFTDFPVLAVPESFDLQSLDRIVLPTDYMHVFSNFELNPVLEIAKIWKARIHVAYAAAEFELKQPQQQHREQLELLLEGIKYRMDQVPLSGKVSDAITQYAQEIDAKLIALPRHRHGLIEKLTREPVVSRIAYSSSSALLVLPQMG